MARYVVISLDPETRERLADFCGKRKSYGKGVNELLDHWEKYPKQDDNGGEE